jgi:hypothetical protein
MKPGKYLVIRRVEGEEPEYIYFRNKHEIANMFNLSLYIIDKIIKKRVTTVSHNIYEDAMNELEITRVPPK